MSKSDVLHNAIASYQAQDLAALQYIVLSFCWFCVFLQFCSFIDVNYEVASPDKQMELFMAYCAFLNSLPVSAAAKITLFNRRLCSCTLKKQA